MNRRSFLLGLPAIAAPAIIRPGILMPIKPWTTPTFSALGGEYEPLRQVLVYTQCSSATFYDLKGKLRSWSGVQMNNGDLIIPMVALAS